MTATTVEVSTPDGPMPLYVATPEGDARGGVIVIQEAFGVTDHIADVTRRYADEGYLAVAPHLYHRQGAPVMDYGNHVATIPMMMALTREGQMQDVGATLGYLEEHDLPASAVGIVGFCLGGSTALVAGVEFSLGAAVTYYGGGRGGLLKGNLGLPPLVEIAPNLQTPWLGLFGDLDAGLPVAEVEQLREAAAQAKVSTELVRYPDADHGFNRDVGKAYHPEAAADAYRRLLAFLEANLTL